MRVTDETTTGRTLAALERLLRVTGRIRTDKIHLGSTSTLMEPDDQYLSIVPSS